MSYLYLGEFEQLILFTVFLLGDDACGVTVRDSIEERTGRAVASGAIYTTLGRLEERGLVRSRPGGRDGPGRPRKYYELKSAGARALIEAYDARQAMAGRLIPRLRKLAAS